MKAMIFAAGKGTRLKPLTNNKPKALIEINNIPLLQYQILKLKKIGIREIIINTHHFHEQIEDFLLEHDNFDINITVSYEKILLETGGGLKNVKDFFNDDKPFLVHNVDIITDLNIMEMLDFHHKSNALATLAIRKRQSSRYFLFDDQMSLCGWYAPDKEIKISKTVDGNMEMFSFMGVHILSPKIFKYIHQKGKFSITETYLDLAKKEHIIKGYKDSLSFWMDVGKIETLNKAQEIIKTIKY